MNLFASLPRVRQFVPLMIVLVSAVVAAVAYLQALNFQFVSDDAFYITDNAKLAGLHFTELWRLFIEPYNPYEFLPLRDLSYWFDITLFGLNPAAFRVHNIILYLLSQPLVYATTLGLWRYFRPADPASAPWAAAAVTGLFVLHPAHVEAVVWISGRKDVLSGLFSLLALWLAVNTKRGQGLSPRYVVATLLALLAAMLSKATTVAVAPVIALLWIIFWCDIPKQDRQRIQLLWPLASLLLAECVTLIFAAYSTVREPAYFGIETLTRMLAVQGWLTRLAISPESRQFFYPVLEDAHPYLMVALGVLVLVAAAASVVMILFKRKVLEGFVCIAFVLLCIPYMQLIPYLSLSLVSDRFLFLAIWPVILLVVFLVWRFNPATRLTVLLIIALLWIFQTVERPRDWHSLETLIDADARTYPGYYLPAAYKIVGAQLPQGLRSDATETAKSISDPDAQKIMIELIDADYVVKVLATASGKPQDAMDILWKFEQDIKPPAQAKWNPAIKAFWKKVGTALVNEWEYLAKQFPDEAPVQYNAGLWLLKVHKYKEAIILLRVATESKRLPDSVRGTALRNLGLALIGSSEFVAAETSLRAALEQSPPDFRAYCSLSDIYKQTGRIAEAARADTGCHSRVPNEKTIP